VAYVHAELFGGHRFQTAVGWEDADIRLGPLITETEPGGEAESWYSVHTGRLAVNEALGWLGVERGQHRDEFEAVELGRHRLTDEWTAI
jgi:hypothetical protein